MTTSLKATKLALALVLIAGFASSGTVPALASEEAFPIASSTSEETDLQLAMELEDGTWQVIEGAPPVATPMLLNPLESQLCWTLNQENYVIRQIPWSNNGVNQTISLTCGTSSYGYKHIDSGHKADWQAKLDAARAFGWVSSQYDIHYWDDLMYFAAVNLIAGQGTQNNWVSMKGCANGNFGLYKPGTGAVAYTFRAEAVISLNNKKVITAFPSSRTWCNNS